MADNYLESRYEAVFGAGATHKTSRQGLTYGQLLSRTVPCDGFDTAYPIHIRQLQMIVSVYDKIANWFPKEFFSFELVTKSEASEIIKSAIGESVSDVDSFIIIRSDEKEVDFALGMVIQSMTVKATEMGLGARLIKDEGLFKEMGLTTTVVAMIGIGKPAKKV